MDGILIVNKEKEWTSNDVVQKVKHITKSKVGHTGTLDPNATGVLPLLIGKGTLLSKYLVNHNKTYIATIKLGEKTTTSDVEGNVIETKAVLDDMLNEQNVKNVLNSFIGKQIQTPPIYSAIKINGKKLYDYARQGKMVEIPTREIEIYKIELLHILIEDKEIIYRVSCSKGTYIRTLSENIAEKLGTVGFMKELNRIKVGDFEINQSIKIKDITDELLKKQLISIEDFFDKNENIILNDIHLNKLFNGVKIEIKNKKDGVYKIYNKQNVFVAVAICKNGFLKRDIWIKR